MRRFLISFPEGAMTFPEEDLPDVVRDSHAVVQQAKDAGVWVTGAGIDSHDVTVVGTDGSVRENPSPDRPPPVGGFAIIDVTSREEALEWAARIAVACRCAQEVRELMPDPDA